VDTQDAPVTLAQVPIALLKRMDDLITQYTVNHPDESGNVSDVLNALDRLINQAGV